MPRLLTVTVEHGGQRFDFQLHERELLFGRAGVGKYLWMDGRQFRQGNAGPNFRACVDLWWELVIAAGAEQQHDNEVPLVFAECYPLVNTARSLQDIYLDAHLHHSADLEYSFVEEDQVRQRRAEPTYLLPEDEVDRLRAVAHTRDTKRVRAELEELFLGELPPNNEMPAYVKAAQSWIGNGIVALRTSGREGLQRHVQSVAEQIRKLRRQSGISRPRTFVNMFAYQCKTAFYHCYANAWVGIFQCLKREGDLDALGERFMRIWHHQNRAATDDDVKRDILCGHILALHPLSRIVLASPQPRSNWSSGLHQDIDPESRRIEGCGH